MDCGLLETLTDQNTCIINNYANACGPTTTSLAWNGELLLIKYRPIIMVGRWCYNQSGVTDLFIMRDPHYGRMCIKSVKTLVALHSLL